MLKPDGYIYEIHFLVEYLVIVALNCWRWQAGKIIYYLLCLVSLFKLHEIIFEYHTHVWIAESVYKRQSQWFNRLYGTKRIDNVTLKKSIKGSWIGACLSVHPDLV